MTWKPRVIIAGICLLGSLVMRYFGVNSYIENIGLLAAGFLFGSLPASSK